MSSFRDLALAFYRQDTKTLGLARLLTKKRREKKPWLLYNGPVKTRGVYYTKCDTLNCCTANR